jgi:hypothetical protein
MIPWGKVRQALVERLWARCPDCTWCGTPTVLALRAAPPGQKSAPNTATLDHVWPKTSAERHLLPKRQARVAVLACYRCNEARNRRDMRALAACGAAVLLPERE